MEKTPPKDSININVCIIPPDGAGKQCVELAQTLASKATMFALDGKTKFPHMTVYMTRVANDQIPVVTETVGNALKGAQRFACDHTGYFRTQGRYMEVSYHKSQEFLDLQVLLIDAVAKLRLNPGNPYEEAYYTPYTLEQQKNAIDTGYDLAGNLYRPHVTLTRYYEGKVSEEFPAFLPRKLSFMLSKICVYKADDNGAVYEKLAEFAL